FFQYSGPWKQEISSTRFHPQSGQDALGMKAAVPPTPMSRTSPTIRATTEALRRFDGSIL
ncbi:MAG: hypothetical protein ACRDGM_20895, partial [bacterium]